MKEWNFLETTAAAAAHLSEWFPPNKNATVTVKKVGKWQTLQTRQFKI